MKPVSDRDWGKFLLMTRGKDHNTLIVGRGAGERALRALEAHGVAEAYGIVEDEAFGPQTFYWVRWQDLAGVGEACDETNTPTELDDDSN